MTATRIEWTKPRDLEAAGEAPANMYGGPGNGYFGSKSTRLRHANHAIKPRVPKSGRVAGESSQAKVTRTVGCPTVGLRNR